MLQVNYLLGAQRDFDESFDWYAKRSAVAARQFAIAVDVAAEPTGASQLTGQ